MVSTLVYETMFLSSFLLLPVLIYKAGWFPYLLTFIPIYISLKVIKQYRKKSISPDHKSVVISGCDTGFGYALALRLHQSGFRVFAGCLLPDGQGATTLKKKCLDNLFVVPLDVTKDDSVKAAEKFVRGHLGDTYLWACVNNAGVHCIGDIEVTSVQTYERVFAVNVFGMLRVTKTFLPLIRQAKGRVVVVSSIAVLLNAPSFSGYSASKTALEYVSDCLRMEMRKFGVKVSIIRPGNFGSNTNINAGDNLKRLYDAAEASWESSSDDVKHIYGRNYTRSIIEGVLGVPKARSVDPVLDVMEDCLVSSNPVYRVVVHGGPRKVDEFAILGQVISYFPEFIRDWLLCKGSWHSDTSNLQGLKNAPLLPAKDGQ